MNDKAFAYVGTYTSGESEGIYAITLDTGSGRLEKAGVAAKLENPSYLAVSTNGKYLYAVVETETYDGKPGGAVGAFAIAPHPGALRLLNIQPTNGRSPCHLSTDRAGKYLFAANYGDGTVTVFSLAPDGCIGPLLSQICHRGSGLDPIRQEGPHAHYAALTPDEKHLCAVDLGIDGVVLYRFHQDRTALNLVKASCFATSPGSGPRHLAFHPNGRFVYLINELCSSIVVMEYFPDDAALRQQQVIATLPEGYTGSNYGAAIHLSPEAMYLYASNRGHDSLAVFKIHATTGMLELIAHISTHGKFPRDFAICPNGKFLLAANQQSNTIKPFYIDGSGRLEPAGDGVELPNPVCIKFVPH